MTCAKTPYSRDEARARAQRMAMIDQRPLNAYQCDEHGAWHVGHPADLRPERTVPCRSCGIALTFQWRPGYPRPIPVDGDGQPHTARLCAREAMPPCEVCGTPLHWATFPDYYREMPADEAGRLHLPSKCRAA